MGIFDKIAGFFEDIFGAIGDALSWLLGVPDADDYAGQLINKNSNVANLPVVYGRRLIGGTRVFVSTGGNNKNEYMYIVLALSEGEIQAINSVYVNDKLMIGTPVSGKPYRKVTGGDYKDIIWYQTFTGTDDQTACTTLFNDIGSGPDDTWGVNHRLRGVAYIAMVVKYHQDKGMTSIPEIRCEIQGRKVYDPRTETTVWTSNPALCLRDYLTNERFGKGLPDSAIDDEAFGAAATFCDSTVSSYTGGPSINTFSLNMILDTGNTLFDNTKRFLLAMRGIMPYSEGKYSLIIDKDDASVGTIDESICTRDITIKSVNKNTKLNQVKAVFVNPYKRYEQDSVIWPPADSLEESTFLAEDNNQVLSKDLTLDTVTNFYQARELARVAVLASRSSSIICELVCTSEALKYAVGDIITLEQPSMGWTGPAAKEFRILSIQLAVSGEVGLTLQEYDSSIYPWVTGSEQDDQPETTLPNPNSVDAITSASVTTGSQVLNDGTIQYFADLTWTPPSDELIQDYVVKINKKVGSVTTENVETITTINNKARYILTDTNAQYGYSIQARNGAQVTSEPFTVAPVAVSVDTTAPGNITNFNASGKLQQIELTWDNPSDPDFDVVYVKVSDTTTEPTEIFAKVKSDTFTHEVGAYSTTKYYWVAPVDSSGNIGNYTGPESATTGLIEIGDIPHVAGTFYLTLGDNDAPTNAEFAGAVGRNPIEGDVAVVNKAYFFTRGASAWTAVTEFIDGSLLVSDSITTTQINADSVLAESILANTADITGDLTVTSGKITVQDTDTVINLDPDAQYPFRISQGTEDVVRLGSSTLDPFIKGAFIRGMPVQSINEADLTTFVRNVVGVTSEEKTETETLTRLPTGGNLVYLEADNITTGLTTVLTLESVAGTQSWVYEYADESDWDSGDSAFFNYTLQGYNGTAWEDISGWVNRPVFASGYRISGALVGWSISETYSRTIENNTYTHFRMVVGNMSGEFGGGLHPTSTGINCDFKLTAVTGSQVNSDNYADSFSINNTSGVLTIGRTGSLGNLTADISTYVGNQVSALVDSAPDALNTLNELAQALGDDENFSTTVNNSIGTKASKSGDTFTGDVTFNTHIKLPQNPVGTTYGNGISTIPTSMITQVVGDNDGWRLYGEAGVTNDVKMIFEIVDDIESGDTWVFRNKKTYGDYSATEPFKIQGNGNIIATGTITASGYNKSNWDTAYGWGNHASAGYLTSIPSEYLTQTEGDSRYQQSDGLHKRFYKSNGNTGAVWYKLGNFPNNNGFLQVVGTIGSHVESFGTSRLDLTIYAREGNSGANVSIDGKFEVAHQGTGLQVYRKDNDGGYESYDIWLKVGNYAQVCIDLNYVNFTYDGTSTTTQPDTSGYFATEIDTTTYGQGSYDVEASAVHERYNSGVFTNNSSNWDTAYGWGNHASAGYLTEVPSTITKDLVIGGSVQVSWGRPKIGNYDIGWGPHPSIGSDGGSAGQLIMLANPHVPYRTDNARVGASGRAGIRCGVNATQTSWWDIGLTGDQFEIYRSASASQLMTLSNTGNVGFSGTIQNGSIWINDGSNYNSYNENIRLFDPENNGPSVIAFGATGTSGSPRNSILSYDLAGYGLDFRKGSTRKLSIRDDVHIDNANLYSPSFRGEGADYTPLGTTFTNAFKGDGTHRTVYFDGDGSNCSVWWGVGNNAHAALDSADGRLEHWVNTGSSWSKIFETTTSGITVNTGSINSNTVKSNGANLGMAIGGYSSNDTDEVSSSVVQFGNNRGNANWDEFLIKGSSARGVFGRTHFGIHTHSSKSFAFHASNWATNAEFSGDGRTYLKGPVGINYTPSSTSDYKLRVGGTSRFDDELTAYSKRHNFGHSANWDEVGFTKQTNVHFQGHNQFWIGAGNGTWFYGTANNKNYNGGLSSDASRAHDLLITTMQGTSAYDRGITFAVDGTGSGNSGWRLGKWHSGTGYTNSLLAIDGNVKIGGGNNNEPDYYVNDYSAYHSTGRAGWQGDSGYGWHNPSLTVSNALQIQSSSVTTSTAKPQIQFHQYGYGGPKIEYDGPSDILVFSGNSARLDWVQFDTGSQSSGLRINFDQVYSPIRPLHLQYSSAQNVYIHGNSSLVGNVGIGASSASERLHVHGNIVATGNITAYYSDMRLKDKIGDIENALDIVSKIETLRYKTNELGKYYGFEADEEQIGVSAQSVQKVLPQVVKSAPFDVINEEVDNPNSKKISKSGKDYITVQYDRLVPVLIEAIKELKSEIEELKNGNN